MVQLSLVLVYHGPLQIAIFWEWLAIYFHHSVMLEIEIIWATATKPLADIPLYWLVHRDPRNDPL